VGVCIDYRKYKPSAGYTSRKKISLREEVFEKMLNLQTKTESITPPQAEGYIVL
jgi:hypothetical protein